MTTSHFDIIVLGGGPAGCAVARGLSELGFSVAIISQSRAASVWEGLSRRTLELLRDLGFAQTLAGLGPEVRREANWNGLTSSLNTEWVVERKRFDAALRNEANALGVAVINGLVRHTGWNGASWTVVAQSREVKIQEFYCKFIIDARGRRAPTAQKGSTRGPATTALRAYWQHTGTVGAMTGVASFPDGWAWYAAGHGGRATLQLIVSGEQGSVPGSRVLGSHYDRVVRNLPEAGRWLAGATRYGTVSAHSAGARLVASVIDERQARVGDAAMTIDPLSGHGIYEALTAVRVLAPVVNTMLRKPARLRQAIMFYRQRMQGRFMQVCRTGRESYAQEQRWPGSGFWEARHQWPESLSQDETQSAAAPLIARRSVIEDGFVTEREVIVTGSEPRGAWVVEDVPLVRLYRLLQAQVPLPECANRLGVSMEQARLARKWLVRNGLLGALDLSLPALGPPV